MKESNTNLITPENERAVIIGMRKSGSLKFELEEHLAELKELARTAGANVVGEIIQERPAPDPAYFIGKGKIRELAELVESDNIQLLIFDDELSPAQARNIERIIDIKVIDRTALILDIFAGHARSSESRTQVELAQLNYLLPRLTRQWQHLSRQVGGIGTKGPGETQLETDRRLIRTRIRHLKQRLKEIEKQGCVRRARRDKTFRVALIGYTNAGKSTLMKALTDADVLIENKLFATLDTTVRRFQTDENIDILISDTVGFIRKLPHQLVASFRSTLAESREADLLLHVVDIFHPHFEDHLDVVTDLLKELELDKKPVLLVFNKTDLVDSPVIISEIRSLYPDAVLISAKRHIGFSSLKKVLMARFENLFCFSEVRLDYTHGPSEHLIRNLATVLNTRYDENYMYLKIKYLRQNERQIQQLIDQYQ